MLQYVKIFSDNFNICIWPNMSAWESTVITIPLCRIFWLSPSKRWWSSTSRTAWQMECVHIDRFLLLDVVGFIRFMGVCHSQVDPGHQASRKNGEYWVRSILKCLNSKDVGEDSHYNLLMARHCVGTFLTVLVCGVCSFSCEALTPRAPLLFTSNARGIFALWPPLHTHTHTQNKYMK